MGDKVQGILEEMVPELLFLQKRALLSKDETRSVVRQRKNFEYALKRRELKKVDFLRYINYEINLEQLIAKRKKIKGIWKKAPLDFARGINFVELLSFLILDIHDLSSSFQ